METTLGKRIMQGRKKLGLTQDKLAESLGVTAQAVSKWENDQSCPDITMLPRLAELFNITVDELLGVTKTEMPQTVALEGTVEDSNSDHDHHNFEMKFEPGKRDAIFMAAFVLFVGALTLISVLLNLGVSFWSILWPCTIMATGIRGLTKKFSFFNVAYSLFGSYFLLENMNITTLNVSWKLIFPVLVLLLGLSLFVDALKKPKNNHWQIKRNGKIISNSSHNGKLVNTYWEDDENFECELAFGDDYRQVTMNRLISGNIDCSFGELTLDLCSCKSFASNCHLNVDCSFGSTTILVPKSVQVIPNSSTAFAGLEIQGSPNTNAEAIINLNADVNFGSLTICYT